MPLCFLSYARGDPEHELWVETRLASDLRDAPAIEVLLDRWHNEKISASIPRFIERVLEVDFVVVVGTPLYLAKYEESKEGHGNVLSAEIDLINYRLITGSEPDKEKVLPVLRSGDRDTSFPPLIRPRLCCKCYDFRDEDLYRPSLLDLILTINGCDFADPKIAEYRRNIRHVTGR